MRTNLIFLILIFALLCGALSSFCAPAVTPYSWSDGAYFSGSLTAIAPITALNHNSTTWTVELWFKTAGIPDSDRVIVSWTAGTVRILVNASQSIGVYDGTSTLFVASFAASVWTHIALDSVNELLYVNGKPFSCGALAISDKNIGGTFYIGRPSSASNYFIGYVKDWRIWRVTRSATEIQENAYTKFTGDETSLYSYVPMDEGVCFTDFFPSGMFTPSVFDPAYSNNLFLSAADRFVVATLTNALAYPFTISQWCRALAVSAGTSYSGLNIASSTTDTFYVSCQLYGNGSALAPRMVLYNGTLDAATGAYSLSPSLWFHLTGVFESAASRTLYLNAIPVASSSVSLALPSGVKSVGVGRIPRPSGDSQIGRPFTSVVWGRALRRPEIAVEMQRNQPATTTSLLLYMPLTETTGSTTLDLSGNNCHGFLGSGVRAYQSHWLMDKVSYKKYPAFTSRYISPMTPFTNGTTDTMVFPASSTVKGCTAATMGGWFYIPAFGVASLPIVRENHIGLAARLAIEVSPTGGAYVGMRGLDAGSFVYGPKNIPIASATWLHLMTTVDTVSDVFSLYINGQLASQVSVAMDAFENTWPAHTMIGYDSANYISIYAHNVCKWTRVLTPAEIALQYRMDSPVSYQNLIGYWPCNEGFLATYTDVSGLNYHGTASGTSWRIAPTQAYNVSISYNPYQRSSLDCKAPVVRKSVKTP